MTENAMTSAKKVLILTATMGNGHNACAKAMEKALLARGAEVKIIDYLEAFAPKRIAWVVNKGYSLSLAHFLRIYNVSYRYMEKHKLDLRFKSGYMQNVAQSGVEPLMREIYTFRPDVIFCTNIYPAMAITDLRMAADIPAKVYHPLLDYTINVGYESCIGIDYFNLVNEDYTEESLRLGYRQEQLLYYGLSSDPKFRVPMDKLQVREQLGMAKDLFTVIVLFGGGQWGGGYRIFRQVVRALEGAPAQIIMLNGRNEKSKKKIDKDIARGIYRDLKIVNVGFTDKVDVYMAAADAIVTKLGGMGASECINRQLPIVAAKKLLAENELENVGYLGEKGAILTYSSQKELAEALTKLRTDEAFRKGIRAAQKQLSRDGITGLAEHILAQPDAVYPDTMPALEGLKKRVAAAVKAAYRKQHGKKN